MGNIFALYVSYLWGVNQELFPKSIGGEAIPASW